MTGDEETLESELPAFAMVPEALLYNPALSSHARVIYGILARHAGERGIFPGRDRLASLLGQSTTTVDRAMKELRKAGWVKVRRRGQGRSNAYFLHARPRTDETVESAPVLTLDSAPVPTPESAPVLSRTKAKEREPEKNPIVELALDGMPAPIDPVQVVWDTWRTSTGHHRAVLDDKRRKRIQRALKNFPLEDVTAAVQGWQHSPWHRGENPSKTVYDSIDTLLRDAAQIEKMRDYFLDGTAVPDTTDRDRDLAGLEPAPRCSTCEGRTYVLTLADEAIPCPVCREGIIP